MEYNNNWEKKHEKKLFNTEFSLIIEKTKRKKT